MSACTYLIELCDVAGVFLEERVVGLAACCDRVRVLTARYPKKVLCISNMDHSDYDTTGMSDGELDAVWDAMAQGHEAAAGREAVRNV